MLHTAVTAANTLDPDVALAHAGHWIKLLGSIVFALGAILSYHYFRDGNLKKAAACVLAMILGCVMFAISLNPQGIGTSILDTFFSFFRS